MHPGTETQPARLPDGHGLAKPGSLTPGQACCEVKSRTGTCEKAALSSSEPGLYSMGLPSRGRACHLVAAVTISSDLKLCSVFIPPTHH